MSFVFPWTAPETDRSSIYGISEDHIQLMASSVRQSHRSPRSRCLAATFVMRWPESRKSCCGIPNSPRSMRPANEFKTLHTMRWPHLH
jgi:hypothetical protein